MRLYELTKVDEITHILDSPNDQRGIAQSGVPKTVRDTGIVIDGQKLYLAATSMSPGSLAVYLLGSASLDDTVASIISQTYTAPSSRGAGLMRSLYLSISSSGVTLYSDISMTTGSRAIWSYLIRTHPSRVRMVDRDTNVSVHAEQGHLEDWSDADFVKSISPAVTHDRFPLMLLPR